MALKIHPVVLIFGLAASYPLFAQIYTKDSAGVLSILCVQGIYTLDALNAAVSNVYSLERTDMSVLGSISSIRITKNRQMCP